MSANQEIIESFPQDGGYWLIKWIDEFRLAHARTRSTSVVVMLQLLPHRSGAEVAKIKPADCAALLGKKSGGEWPKFAFAKVLVGALPLLTVGAVFKDRVKVGELPWLLRRISFLPGDLDDNEVEAGQLVDPPPDWPKEYPCKMLNPSEYVGLIDHKKNSVEPVSFTKSRLAITVRRNGRHQEIYIIPRTTIFKAFYAPHSEIAKAFSGAPWSTSLPAVICMSDLESGLKTEIINNNTQWNIILQTLVPNEFAHLLAILMFDPHGKACAEAIYTRSLQDRSGAALTPWYASARIPYRAVNEAFPLSVKCLQLRHRFYKDNDGQSCEIRKFLVTEICGSGWPTHYPLIGWEKANSGVAAANSEAVELPKPYHARPRPKDGNLDTKVSSDHDAHTSSSMTTIRGGEWNWLEGSPPKVKLVKEFSRRYKGTQAEVDDPSDVVSTGAHTSEQATVSKGETKTLVRVPNARFEQIMQVFEILLKDKTIADATPIGPRRPGQGSDRNGYSCWRFIDEETRTRGLRPRLGWRLLERGTHGMRDAIYRTALVVELTIDGAPHHWIEIECRTKETGYTSTLLSKVVGDVHDIIEATIDIIAEERGRNLKKVLGNAFYDDGIEVDSYRHHYTQDRTKVGVDTVRKFLQRATGSSTQV